MFYAKMCFVLLLCVFGACSFHNIVSTPDLILDSPEQGNKYVRVPRLVSASEGVQGLAPYQISFRKLRGKLYVTYCNGALLGPRRILTAAFCFASFRFMCCDESESRTIPAGPMRQLYAVAGSIMYAEAYQGDVNGTQWKKIQSVYYPTAFRFPENDIAVAVTFTAFTLDEYVNNIPFARRANDYTVQKCHVSAYGGSVYSNEKRVPSRKLLYASLKVLSNSWCTESFKKNMTKFICAKDITPARNAQVTKNDAGGPLVCIGTGEADEGSKGILVGLVIGPYRKMISTFTRISPYTSFIRDSPPESCKITKCRRRNNCSQLLLNYLLTINWVILVGFYFFWLGCQRL